MKLQNEYKVKMKNFVLFLTIYLFILGFHGDSVVKNPSACQCKRRRGHSFDPWVGKIAGGDGNPLQYPWLGNSRGAWQVTIHGPKETDTTE